MTETGKSIEILNTSATLTVKKAQEQAEVERILAQGRVEALLLLMDAEERYLEKLAGATEMLNAAENTLSSEIIEMRLKMALMHCLPAVLKETKKPIEELIQPLRELIK